MAPIPPEPASVDNGLVGVDDSNTVVVVSADDDEVLPVFDDGSDAVRIVELRFERVGVVNAASSPVDQQEYAPTRCAEWCECGGCIGRTARRWLRCQRRCQREN